MKDLRNNKGGSSSGPGENVYSKEEVDALIDNIGEIAQGTYTNTDKVPVTLGGIVKDSTFNKVPMSDMWDKLLYPYQAPSFSSFTIDNKTTETYEVGQTIPEVNRTFRWSIANKDNVLADSLLLNNEIVDLSLTSKIVTMPELVRTTSSTYSYNIKAKDITNKEFSRNININWQYRRYFGVSNKDTLLDSDILALTSELSTSKNKTIEYDMTGGNYFYFAYPTAFGDCNNIKVNEMPWNGFILVKRTVVNAFGVNVPMNIYRSENLLYGTSSVNWS